MFGGGDLNVGTRKKIGPTSIRYTMPTLELKFTFLSHEQGIEALIVLLNGIKSKREDDPIFPMPPAC